MKLIRSIFILSGIALTVLLSVRPIPVLYYMVEIVLCAIIWGYIASRYKIVYQVVNNSNKTDIIIATLLSVAFIPVHYDTLNYLINKFEQEDAGFPASYEPYVSFFLSHKTLILVPLITFAAISLCFICIYLSGRLRNPLIYFFRGLEKYEKIFLVTSGLVAAAVVIMVFNLTNVFYQPYRDGEVFLLDVIYTSDAGAIVGRNCYANPAAPENDLRQPLFGIFAMPFGLLAKAISFVFPFPASYPISINIIQIMLFLISMVLLSRMLEVSNLSRVFFLVISVSTFPFMLFALNMEQYMFAVFWTILLIYTNYKTNRISSVLSVAAAGSILTSGILVPVLMVINKEYRRILKKGWNIILIFCAVFICGGMISVIHKLNEFVATYQGFMNTSSGFSAKFRQFTHFVASCLFAPCSRIVSKGELVSYQLCESNFLSITGGLILGLSLLSGFLFRHKYIVKVSFCWVGFAFILICLLGWGTAENGTILYSLYIFWAFVVLLTLLIDSLPIKVKSVKIVVFLIFVVLLMMFNIKGILEIINFGIVHYPVI